MSHYTSIAIVGTGIVGKAIIESLLTKSNVTTVLLRRQESKSDYAPAGLVVEALDLLDEQALAAVFTKHKTQVVVSAVGVSAYDEQVPIARALKAAGGQLFVPSEFGYPSIGAKTVPELSRKEYNKNTFGVKFEVAEEIQKILPITRIFNNAFTEFIGVVANLESGSFQIAGKGETPVSFTAIKDVGNFVAGVVTTLAPEELANKTFHISSEKLSLNDIGALFKGKYEIVYIEKFEDPSHMTEFRNTVHKFIEAGTFSGESAGSANHLFPGYKWTPIKDTVEELKKQ